MSNAKTKRPPKLPTREELEERFDTVVARITFLAKEMGHDRSAGVNKTSAIAKHLGIRYQWVRNELLRKAQK